MAAVSIIVTSYNIEDYLEECLDSIVGQTLRDVEIIVVDDGSSDSSPDIIRQFAERDSRIVPVLLGQNSPGGVATAANAGLDRATGSYVGFADGDDVCEPDMFDKLWRAAVAADADLSMCNYRLFNDGSFERTEPADERRWADFTKSSYRLDDERRREFLGFVAVPWRKLYRREFLDEHAIRFPVGDYFYEDNPFHWFCLVQAESIALVPQVLCYHRLARPGQTMQTADERLFRIFAHHETIYDFLIRENVLEAYRPTLLAWAISQMEWISRRTPSSLRRQLFETLRTVFQHYSSSDIDRALALGRKGETARQLSKAVSTNNFARFNLCVDGTAAKQNPVLRGWYHLRYSGPLKTAKITARYARQRLEGVTMNGGLRTPFSASKGVSNEQLMFALAVLERRLDRIEQQLRDR